MYINKKCDATEVDNPVNSKIKEFSLNLKTHAADVTSDIARVIKKFSTNSDAEHSLCLDHCLHLAVTDVLINRKEDQYSGNEEKITKDQNSVEEDFYIVLNRSILQAIRKTRKMIKKFRKNHEKNLILQSNVR